LKIRKQAKVEGKKWGNNVHDKGANHLAGIAIMKIYLALFGHYFTITIL
jgi:hypothetical protein